MILVTGGSGFVGQHLITALRARPSGEAIRLFDTTLSAAVPAGGVEVMYGSVEDPEAMAAAVQGVDIVIHLAARVQPNSHARQEMWNVNVNGARNAYLAAVESGCGLFLHMSSAGVYGPPRRALPFTEDDVPNPVTPYQLSKWEAEQALREIEPRATTLNVFRPAGIYGPGSHLELARYNKIRTHKWSIELSGGVVVHPTNSRDIVQAMLAVIDAPAPHATVFNIGGERAILLQDLQGLVAETLNVPWHRLVIPSWVAVPLSAVAGLFLHFMGRRDQLLWRTSRGQLLSAAVDDGTFRKRYPDVPVIRLEDGVREHVEWAQRQGLL